MPSDVYDIDVTFFITCQFFLHTNDSVLLLHHVFNRLKKILKNYFVYLGDLTWRAVLVTVLVVLSESG